MIKAKEEVEDFVPIPAFLKALTNEIIYLEEDMYIPDCKDDFTSGISSSCRRSYYNSVHTKALEDQMVRSK
jgi:hypothetical protein